MAIFTALVKFFFHQNFPLYKGNWNFYAAKIFTYTVIRKERVWGAKCVKNTCTYKCIYPSDLFTIVNLGLEHS